jgi:cytochrome c5
MHCTKKVNVDIGGDDVACYVTNYGDIDTSDLDDAEAARTNTAPVATVAMEYAPIESQPGFPVLYDDPERVVKFFVYDAAGNRINAANLDKRGARPIPQLCMVCHNGEYPGGDVPTGAPSFPDRDSVKLQSKFLPFDLHAYEYPTTAGFTKADQQDEFKKLNQDYVLASSPGTAITELINGWYLGGALTQNENYIVPSWVSATEPLKEQTYRDVVGRSCRTCHVSQLDPALVFNQASQFVARLGSIENRVCVQHVMPHAKKTHDLFWDSIGPHQPGVLQLFGDTYGTVSNGWNGQLCGTFVPGGSTPVTFFTSTIQPLFNTNCTGCHVGGSPPGNMSLAASSAYAQIVNVTSTESASGMKRITPSSTTNSYLYRKVTNTHLGAPANGSGSSMPPGSTLPGADVTNLATWITNGATP